MGVLKLSFLFAFTYFSSTCVPVSKILFLKIEMFSQIVAGLYLQRKWTVGQNLCSLKIIDEEHLYVITDRIRTMGECNVFTGICLFTG